jgi:hypothetical protein
MNTFNHWMLGSEQNCCIVKLFYCYLILGFKQFNNTTI